MIEPGQDVVLTLARLRQRGCLPAGGVRLGDVERAAELAGRRVQLIDAGDGGSLLVLGWQGAEPAASAHAPKLSRRALPRKATRTLVVLYALLNDPQANRAVVATAHVLATVELLMGRAGNSWVLPALQDTLPRAGLTAVGDGGWCAGPTMHVWDAPTRDAMAHAARGLWQHPNWPDIPDA
jgi:hypothetical protein